MRYEVVETCPHCDEENVMLWNVELCGYVAYCNHCGKKMMLCDECFHSDDNSDHKCDWSEDKGCFRDKHCRTKNT